MERAWVGRLPELLRLIPRVAALSVEALFHLKGRLFMYRPMRTHPTTLRRRRVLLWISWFARRMCIRVTAAPVWLEAAISSRTSVGL